MTFREKLIRFMQGRYGIDEFTRFLFTIGIATWVITIVLRFFIRVGPIGWIYSIVSAINTFVYVWGIFRILSRNIEKRRLENDRYLIFRQRIFPFIEKIRNSGAAAQERARQRAAGKTTKQHNAYRNVNYTYTNPAANTQTKKVKDKEHIFRNCPNCDTKLRLKKIRGKHNTVCPKCGHAFSVRVIF